MGILDGDGGPRKFVKGRRAPFTAAREEDLRGTHDRLPIASCCGGGGRPLREIAAMTGALERRPDGSGAPRPLNSPQRSRVSTALAPARRLRGPVEAHSLPVGYVTEALLVQSCSM